jgi:hypothetical protein
MRKDSLLGWILLTAALGLFLGTARAEDRLSIQGKVNGRSVRLALDTGSDSSCLFRATVVRLGLKTTDPFADSPGPIEPGHVRYDVTEDCTVTIGDLSERTKVAVIDGPPHQDVDGIIGWTSFSNRVFQVDMDLHVPAFLDGVPSKLDGWKKWRIVPEFPRLEFECSNEKEKVRIGIDTGSSGGVELSPRRWKQWCAQRVNRRATLKADWQPSDGLVVREELRAKEITIGGLSLKDVPVFETTPSADILFKDCDAIFGLFVFKRLKVIIDGKNGWVYTSPLANASYEYPYNRLGAVFVPKDLEKTDDLIAQVRERSPAYSAGIRDGDILLKIGDLDVTKWRVDPRVLPLARFWSQTPGTKLNLTLKRNRVIFESSVALEELPAVE